MKATLTYITTVALSDVTIPPYCVPIILREAPWTTTMIVRVPAKVDAAQLGKLSSFLP